MNTAFVRPGRALGIVMFLAIGYNTDHLAASQTQGVDDRFIDSISDIKRSIAPVVCRGPDEAGQPVPKRVLGTAFFTHVSGQFVTATHVLAEMKNVAGGCVPAVYLPTAGWRTDLPTFEVRAYNFSRCVNSTDALGVSVCRTDNDLTKDGTLGVGVLPVVVNSVRHPDGTPVAFSGFSLESLQPLTSRGSTASYRGGAGIPDGEVVIDKNGWPGVSGGPVYLANGQVIGMVVARDVANFSGVTIARTHQSILRGLTEAAERFKPK